MAAMLNAAKAAGVPAQAVGQTGGASLTVAGRGAISLERLKKAHESWLPGYMNGKAS
jgi:phosphoribosylformylglycinamidine synthase